ncbi:MAG: IPT/TIG domain-containing protein [Nocardioidaceae bacterium]
MRRLATALVLLTGAALLVTVSPASPASAGAYSSAVTISPSTVREGDKATVTAQQVLDANGLPVTTGAVTISWSASPFVPPPVSLCPIYDPPSGPYTCTIDLTGAAPGFYTAAVLYEPPSTGITIYDVGEVTFLVAPPLVATTTQLTSASPLTTSGGTLTATITHATDPLVPTGIVDFAEGTTTFCSGVAAENFGLADNGSQASCTLSSLSQGTHHITATYSGDSHYAGSSGSLDVTLSAPLAITSTALPTGQVGTPYTATLAATGGTAPLHWALVQGQSLPEGLTLGDTGTISGTPTGPAWSGSVGVVVTDSASPASSASASLSLTIQSAVQPAARLTLTGVSPKSGPAAGGTLVTLSGSSLGQAVRVTVGGTAVSFTASTDGTRITLRTPPHAPGKVRIVVYGAGSTKSSVPFVFRR